LWPFKLQGSLREKPTIQKLFASLLVAVFTISFVPKSFFHDLLANHQDVISCEHPGKEATCVHPKGFNCSFDDLVVSTPYVVDTTGFSIGKPDYYISYTSLERKLVLQQYFLGTESRGPPSIVVA
jgi:hypothetical protein